MLYDFNFQLQLLNKFNLTGEKLKKRLTSSLSDEVQLSDWHDESESEESGESEVSMSRDSKLSRMLRGQSHGRSQCSTFNLS